MGRHHRARRRVSGPTWIVLSLLAVALLVLWGRYEDDVIEGGYTPPPAPANWGQGADDKKWNDEADAISHTALADVRRVAEKWGATVAALLGVFGVVVFAKGPDALTEIPGNDAYAVLALALLAVVFAAAATYCGALAAQGTPASLANLNGWTLKQLYSDRLPKAVRLLKASRALALAAALLILGAVAIGWLAALDARAASNGQSALVVRADGSVICGKLKRSSGQLVLDSGTGPATPLTQVRQVVTVDDCPT
jgi:hypothetical protein